MPLLPERKLKLPYYIPVEIRNRLKGRTVVFSLPSGARARLRRRHRVLPSVWNEKYRKMPLSESHPGRWQKEIAPHSAWIMDLWALPSVRDVWFCGPDQASKTSSMLGCMATVIDTDPGNMFYTASTEEKTKEIVNDKLIPMLRESRRLKKIVSKRADDTGMSKIRLGNGVTIRVAWSNSPASTASFSARYTYNDEVDKWQRVGKETNPIRRIKKRAKNYPHTHKHFWCSTPAGQYIYKGMMACQQIWTHAARCPDCFELVVMDEEHIVIPEGATEESVKADPGCIMYACNACGSLWDEAKRLTAYRNGDKYCMKGAEIAEPVDVGVHMTGFVTPDMRMADIAMTMIAARGGDLDAKIDLAHGIKCIDYEEEKIGQIEVAGLLKFKSELPRNLVPPDTARLGLLVDTQQSSFYYELWAFGYAPQISLHMVNHGILDIFEDIEGLLTSVWQDHEEKQYRIAGGLIDSGGTRQGWQKHSRTVEVYEWCSRNRVMMPHKGMHGRTGDMISYKQIATFPNSNKPIPGGLKRANIRVDLFKDELERRLGMEPDNPGALSFHCEIDDAFAKHFTAESKDAEGDWVHDRKIRNDYWDCANYALVLREMWKMRIPRKPAPPPDTPQQPVHVRRPGGFVKGWKR